MIFIIKSFQTIVFNIVLTIKLKTIDRKPLMIKMNKSIN